MGETLPGNAPSAARPSAPTLSPADEGLLRRGQLAVERLIATHLSGDKLPELTEAEWADLEEVRTGLWALSRSNEDAARVALAITTFGAPAVGGQRHPSVLAAWINSALDASDGRSGREWDTLRTHSTAILAESYHRLGDMQSAADCYERALAAKLPGDVRGTVMLEVGLASTLADLGRAPQAIRRLEGQLATARTLHDDFLLGLVLHNLSMLCNLSGRHRAGLEHARESYAVSTRANDHEGQANALGSQAVALRSLGDVEAALPLFSQAVEVFRGLSNHRDVARCQADWGLALLSLNRVEEAQDCFQESQENSRASGDVLSETAAASNLALIADRLGDRPRAERHWRECLELAERAGNVREQAVALLSIGRMAKDSGDREQARRDWDAAVLLARAADDKGTECALLHNLAGLAADAGDATRAQDLGEQLVTAARALGDAAEEATALTTLGVLYRRTGHPAKAMLQFTRALELARDEADAPLESQILLDMGRAQEQLGNLTGAIASLESCSAVAQRACEYLTVSFALTNIGLCNVGLGRRQAAIDATTAAVAVARAANSPQVAKVESILQRINDPIGWMTFTADAEAAAARARKNAASSLTGSLDPAP